jgi:diguanylate cyclase (GGDEF)-like protein
MDDQVAFDNLNKFGIQDIIIDLFNALSVVRELSELDCQANDEKKLIKNALAALIQNQDMERCSFFLLNERGYLVNLTGIGTNDSSEQRDADYKPLEFKMGEGIIGIAAQTGELQHCQNCLEDKRFASSRRSTIGSVISVPVGAANNELVGVLNISHHETHFFSEWHVRLLEIYKNMLGQLITNYRLFQQMEAQISTRTAKLEQAMVDLQSLKEHYQSISMIDQLTGLYNRRYFYDQVEFALANTRRYEQPLCVLMLDLDNFKEANDNHGHGFGDKVLVKVSQALQKEVRDTDILVRFGGEEFVVIFTNTDCINGEFFAERIRKTVANLVWEGKEDYHQTVSSGLYCINDCCIDDPKDQENIDKIIQYADTALYRAKLQGRNKVVTYTEDMKK